jgi:hypothetical protein
VGLWVGTTLEDFIHEPAALPFTVSGSGHERPDRLLVLDGSFVVRSVDTVP